MTTRVTVSEKRLIELYCDQMDLTSSWVILDHVHTHMRKHFEAWGHSQAGTISFEPTIRWAIIGEFSDPRTAMLFKLTFA